MKRKRNKQEEGGSWMDTYGDMVTLLLCFFVLLYAMSSVDQVKWENLVKSLNPNAEEVSQVVTDTKLTEGTEEVPGNTDADQRFEAIYDNIKNEMKELGVASDVELVKGDDYQFISYKDKVFFDGDSPVITKEGQRVLDGLCRALKPSADTIKELRVMGHTSQETPDRPNNVQTDRQLAALRSANVVIYIQNRDVLEPSRLVDCGYGQFHPIATFATAEGRSKNRRAEILITKKGSQQNDLSDYYNENKQQDKGGAD